MDLSDFGRIDSGKLRLVQEMVPGKQVTLAHKFVQHHRQPGRDHLQEAGT